MRSSKNGHHFTFLLFVFMIVLIGTSGFVSANRSASKEKTKSYSQVDKKSKTESSLNAFDEDDATFTKPAHRKKGRDLDKEDFDDFDDEFTRANFGGKVVKGNLPSIVCLVQWRHMTDKISEVDEQGGYYDTIGTIVSRRAIVAVPSAYIKVEGEEPKNPWYVKNVVVRLDTPEPVERNDSVTYFHPNFSHSLDKPNRLALIILNEDIIEATDSMLVAILIGNPLVPLQQESYGPFQNDDFALAGCTLIVYKTKGKAADKTVAGIPMSATKCLWNPGPDADKFYEDKVCGHVRMTEAVVKLDDTRFLGPNDMGAPLFCNGALAGIYVGIHNLDVNDHAGKSSLENTGKENFMGGTHQYLFDNPASDSNLEFIEFFTHDDYDEELQYSPRMPVVADGDACSAATLPPYTGPPKGTRPTSPPTKPPTTEGNKETEEPKKKSSATSVVAWRRFVAGVAVAVVAASWLV